MKAATSSARFGIGDRPVDVGRAAVALELERVDLVRLGELRDDRAHRRDVHVGAVQHDQRIARAGDLVIHLHAVDLDAVADRFGPAASAGPATSRAAAMRAVRNMGSPLDLVRFSALTIRRTAPPQSDMVGPKFLPMPGRGGRQRKPGDQAELVQVAAEKLRLRDITALPATDDAKTLKELRAIRLA